MALAWALSTIDAGDREGARLTNYGEFRERFPAAWEVEIAEDTSWSCAHGVERWRHDCGCASGTHPGWRQTWRRPLRDALDWLRDRAADVFERAAAPLLEDPWAARDAYIDVVLDRSPERIRAFLAGHARATVDQGEVVRVLELMELQRNAMLMYTSCGWFFDELSGIETVQVLAYAARVAELAERIGGEAIEPELVDRLAVARSNLDRFGDGRGIWQQLVAPSRVGLAKVVAHHAVLAAITPESEPAGGAQRIYCYDVVPEGAQRSSRTGKARLVAGTVRCTSRITHESADLSFAALHLGEHNVVGGVRPWTGEAWRKVVAELDDAFDSADLLATQRAIDHHFAGSLVSLGSLFGRERDRALSRILETSLADAEAAFRTIYDEHAPLMRYLTRAGVPVPETFRDAASLVLRHRILAALRRDTPTYEEVRASIVEADQVKVDLDTPEIGYAAGQALHRMIDVFTGRDDPALLEQLAKMAEVAARMESPVDLWHAQNTCVALRERRLPEWGRREAAGDDHARRLIAAFARLCAAIHVYVEIP
jgi:hypothetical protein